jgi:hypothetical protein
MEKIEKTLATLATLARRLKNKDLAVQGFKKNHCTGGETLARSK